MGLAGALYGSGADCLNITKSAYSDVRFHPPMDQLEGYRTQTAMCIPIYDLNSSVEASSLDRRQVDESKGNVIGIIQVLK